MRELYVCVHIEFDQDHKIHTTLFGGSRPLSECVADCKLLNSNGFNYKPYSEAELFDIKEGEQ